MDARANGSLSLTVSRTAVTEHREEIGGVSTHWREAPTGDGRPIVYVHGVPTGSWEWLPFLDRVGGIAPDLPGFAESGRPEDFDYSFRGFDRWLEQFVDARGLDRLRLVVHDWGGGVGLAFAQRFPERIERLVVLNSVPLLPGYRWHWIARIWRRRGLGEAFMATSSKSAFRLISRQANYTKGPLPDDFIDRFWPDFDPANRRAILQLYRSAPEDELARAGGRLDDIKCPALVLWATNDPYLGREFGAAYAAALGNAELDEVDRAGHWAWLDRPEVIDRVATFLTREA
jgi:pimeloyl-ACP methyl ester carboxylesterase